MAEPSLYQRLIGGLLGEDLSKMDEEERKRLTGQATSRAVQGLLTGEGLLGGLGGYRRERQAEALRQQRQAQQRAKESQMNQAIRASAQMTQAVLEGRSPLTAAETMPDASGLALMRGPRDLSRLAGTLEGQQALLANPELREAVLGMAPQGPATIKPTSDITNFLFSQDNPEFAEFMRNKPPLSSVSLDMGPKASEVMLESFNTRLDNLWSSATSAENTLYSISVMEDALARGAPSGAFAEGLIGASQFLDSLGINYNRDIVANAQEFKAQSSVLLASIMDQLGGARGITPEELKLLQQQFPQIVDSPEARRAVFRILRKGSERTIQQYNDMLGQFKKAFPEAITPYEPKVIIDENKMRDFINSPEGQAELERIRRGG